MADQNGVDNMGPASEEDNMRAELENLQIQMNAKTDEVSKSVKPTDTDEWKH